MGREDDNTGLCVSRKLPSLISIVVLTRKSDRKTRLSFPLGRNLIPHGAQFLADEVMTRDLDVALCMIYVGTGNSIYRKRFRRSRDYG